MLLYTPDHMVLVITPPDGVASLRYQASERLKAVLNF